MYKTQTGDKQTNRCNHCKKLSENQQYLSCEVLKSECIESINTSRTGTVNTKLTIHIDKIHSLVTSNQGGMYYGTG